MKPENFYVLMAINTFDIETLKEAINDGFDVRQLAEDKDIYWDIRRNIFPEADNLENFADDDKREKAKKISDRLAKGHEMLKFLASSGLVLIDSWENYSLYGACDNYHYENNKPALWHAVSPEALKILLSEGLDVNMKDSIGWTALHYIAYYWKEYFNFYGMVKTLLDAGADPTVKNNAGEGVLDMLFKCGCIPDFADIALLVKAGAKINCEINYINYDEEDFNLRLPAAHSEMENFGFEQVDSFADLIKNNDIEDLVQAVKNGFDMDVSDVDDLRLIEAAVQLGETELVKECLNNCEDGLVEMLLLRELEEYDVKALKTMLSAGADTDYIKTLGWHFVSNYIPEANNPDDKAAIEFKRKLDKGSEILSVLHEYDPEIPDKDNNNHALSYLKVQEDYGDPDDDLESIPVKYDDISIMRHAVSPMALSEIIDSVNDVNSMVESQKPRFKRTTREEIRRLFTPEDFINASNDDYDDDDDDINDLLEELSRMFSPDDFVSRDSDDDDTLEKLSQKFSSEDFVTRDDDDSSSDDEGNNEDEPQNLGKTILHIIVKNCEEYFAPSGIIELLCSHGADVNALDFDSRTPAKLLAKNHEDSGHALECLYALLRAGASSRAFLDLVQINHFDCLASSVFTDILAGIVYNSGEINDISEINNTKLLIAAFNNDILRIRQALSEGADVNINTTVGYTPLMIAAMFGTPETIKFLLDNGADINATTSYSGEKALNLSARAREDTLKTNAENIRVLIENGADINFCDNNGYTPLIVAILTHLNDLDVLLSLGADVNMKTENGKSPLSLAIEKHDKKALIALLKAGVNPDLSCSQGD